MYYTYIIKLSNGELYAGSTKNLQSRIKKHQAGGVSHTRKFRPIRLVWYAAFTNSDLAAKFEKYLKSSSGKAFRSKRLI